MERSRWNTACLSLQIPVCMHSETVILKEKQQMAVKPTDFTCPAVAMQATFGSTCQLACAEGVR